MKEENLTIGELIKHLQKEDQNAVIAIENNGYPYTTTIMSRCGWLAGDYYMLKEHRIQKEYFMKDEIPKGHESLYTKAVIINTMIDLDDVKKSGIIKDNSNCLH